MTADGQQDNSGKGEIFAKGVILNCGHICGVYRSEDGGNYYCIACNKGQGNPFYSAMQQLESLRAKIASNEITMGAKIVELLNQNADLKRQNGKYFKALKEIEAIKGSPPFQVARTIAGRATL